MSRTAAALPAFWTSIWPAVLGEMGGCGALISAMVRVGNGGSSSDVSDTTMVSEGNAEGEARGDSMDGSRETGSDIAQRCVGQRGSLQR